MKRFLTLGFVCSIVCLFASCATNNTSTQTANIESTSIPREDVARIEQLLVKRYSIPGPDHTRLRYEIRNEVFRKGVAILYDEIYWLEWMQNRITSTNNSSRTTAILNRN